MGSESGISVHPLPVRIGVGNAELRENLLFETFHGFGVVVLFVIVADQMQETVDRINRIGAERVKTIAGQLFSTGQVSLAGENVPVS